ncbi:MAG: EamA family transporter [bacterium]|nr:EamA family transporter [bacterium]
MNKTLFPTTLGLLAIIFWSTSVAFSRTIAEHMGTLNTAFFNLLFSGLLLLLLQWLISKKNKKKFLPTLTGLPFSYILKVGIFMALYMVVFYMAIGEATSREAVVVAGIINYLWPGLTFLFSVPILKLKAKKNLLYTGVLIAFTGTAVALFEGNRLSIQDISASLNDNLWPYLFAFAAALLWGLYSNMVRKFKVENDSTAVPLMFLLASLLILTLQLLNGEFPKLSLSGWQYLEFTYLVVFPTALAYLFWNSAMRDGNKNLVVAISYLIPLASTAINGLYLNIKISPGFWTAASMVLLGAVLCRMSIKD